MEKQTIIKRLLQDVSEGKMEPKFSDYGIDIREFADIVDIIQAEGFITGAKVVRGGQGNPSLMTYLDSAKLTFKGISYMDEIGNNIDFVEITFTDEELERRLLEVLYNERGNSKDLTIGRIKKLLPIRLNINKLEWLINNLYDSGFLRIRKKDSIRGSNGNLIKGEIVHEITIKGVNRIQNENDVFNDKGIKNKGVENILKGSKKVFIIHGHDNEMKQEVQLLLTRAGLDEVVLHECSDKGRTIIDKLIEESSEGVYVVALLSPDDVLKNGDFRARQNVILEIGYFLGKFGKEKVRLLKRGNVEIPSDLQGILYQEFDEQGSWRMKLLKELSDVGIPIDFANVIKKL